MRKATLFLWAAGLSFFLYPGLKANGQQVREMENARYRVQVSGEGTLVLINKPSGHKTVFQPTFLVMFRPDAPGKKLRHIRKFAFVVPGWKIPDGGGFTTDYFRAADTIRMRAVKAQVQGNTVHWRFKENAGFDLRAEMALPRGKGDPKVTFYLTARQRGWYSVGYGGAPETSIEKTDGIFQPLIWQEKRFPDSSYLSGEFMCTIPSALVCRNGYTVGVAADSSEIPFRFPTRHHSRFGVLVRNGGGNAQPMLFAPVLGQQASSLDSGDSLRFSCRLVAKKGNVYTAYKYIATHLMGFHDYRKNATCSLNETLENMIAYAMNDFYSGWNKQLKAPDYSTDVPGTVKLVSALHPLSIAIVTDNKQIYTRRALPMIEYLMSRQKYLFSERTDIRGQSPSHFLKGPAANVSELTSLYEISKERSGVFKHDALELYGKPRVLNLKMVSAGDSWQNSLALYRMTGNQVYLKKAERGADQYIAARINTPQEDFSDVHIPDGGQFWTDFAPKWIDLMELYAITRQKRYLEAARKGAEEFVEYIWMEPAPPKGEVTINKGGEVGKYAYQNRLNPYPEPMKAPQQQVEAWRLSQTGLISEASTTYVGNRAIFLDHYAAYLLKLSYYTGDKFFHDIARSAIVGRYANFPGYSIMGEYTDIYGRPDYPLKSLWEMTYNNIYYNHVWPQIALLMDYLVSDAYTSSAGAISFPSRYAEGYAYLQSDVYGDRKGRFYEDDQVQLWMPAHVIKTDNIQANYLTGYGNNNLYICLMNQSEEETNVKIRLNPNIVPFSENAVYNVNLLVNNKPAPAQKMKNGTITVKLKPHGITGIRIRGISVTPQFQGEILSPGSRASSPGVSIHDGPFGKVTGMIIDMGASLKEAYIYLQATEKEVKKATLRYKAKDQWKSVSDSTYPFEFSVPIADTQKQFQYQVEAVNVKGNQKETSSKTMIK
jgi:hypothetical protein